MLKAKNISLNINENQILDKVSFNVECGKFVAVLGPNGAGKSSLLKCVTGNLNNFLGEVKIEGKDITSYSEKELAKKRAVLSQSLEIAFPFSVSEIVMMGRNPHIDGREGRRDAEIVENCLKMVAMEEFVTRQFNSLSGGEKQRVLLAKTLAQLEDGGSQKGKYMFLDEPTSALDLKQQSLTLNLVKDLVINRNIGVMAILHDINLAAKYADEIILLKDGKVIKSGETKKVLNKKNLEDLFDLNIQTLNSEEKQKYFLAG